MEKRYQVFISSTFEDLQGARQEVSQALLRAKCFPAGMELFPAADEEQMEFIREVIRQSDYCILISAGRYGSVHPRTGKSFTEMEYDYAVEIGKPVIRLLHRDPLSLSDESPEKQEMLLRFREKVSENNLVNSWSSPQELGQHVLHGLYDAIVRRPSGGWIKGYGKKYRSVQRFDPQADQATGADGVALPIATALKSNVQAVSAGLRRATQGMAAPDVPEVNAVVARPPEKRVVLWKSLLSFALGVGLTTGFFVTLGTQDALSTRPSVAGVIAELQIRPRPPFAPHTSVREFQDIYERELLEIWGAKGWEFLLRDKRNLNAEHARRVSANTPCILNERSGVWSEVTCLADQETFSGWVHTDKLAVTRQAVR